MKIVLVSMPNLHFFRWTDQLKDSGHEVYWFDISGMSPKVEKINWVQQKVNWKLKINYWGRSFVKKHFPKVYKFVQKYNEKNTALTFEYYLNQIQPDVVHSFALYVSCAPIISVMEKKTNLKWIYSSWGSDLFYFQNFTESLNDIKRVLPRVDYLFTDCKRDYAIAKSYGFTGRFLGVFPGGGGFDLVSMEAFKLPYKKRKIILIKGFQGRSGRVIPVFKAIEKLQKELMNYQIVVFGTDVEAFSYLESSALLGWDNFKAVGKIAHVEVLQLMGKSLIYIGNSNSDGMPNTMLEALCMGVFPIQSNPGNATAELIQDGINGLLIEDCEDVTSIEKLVLESLYIDFEKINNDLLIRSLDIIIIENKVQAIYKTISDD
jgi:glycosyltransferase involved in cell wall biosynthesis